MTSPNKYTLVEFLRQNDELAKNMSIGGYIEWNFFQKFFNVALKQEEFIDGKYVSEFKTPDGKLFIKATYGHKGKIADLANYGQYVRYDGPYRIFCFTHTTLDGLGAINFKRTFNLLNIPERCENKGVKAYVDIVRAMGKGVEFWSPIGDRYKNKIFCFDLRLSEYICKIEYVDDYASEQRLLKTHSSFINHFKERMFGDENDEAKTKKALKIVQSMIIEDDIEEGKDIENCFEANFKGLKV
jgi:hypothetical protein